VGLAFGASALLASATAFSDEVVVTGTVVTKKVIVAPATPYIVGPTGFMPWYGVGWRPMYWGGPMYGPMYYQPYGAYGISPYMANAAHLDNRTYLKCIKAKLKDGEQNVAVNVRGAMVCETQIITVKVETDED
jgi:hypothetical protein